MPLRKFTFILILILILPAIALLTASVAFAQAPGAHSPTAPSLQPIDDSTDFISTTAVAKSWRVAQAVTEKEAFDLAKDVGTAQAWRAFLAKFPDGFRAEIARSYIEKLGNGDAQARPDSPTTTRPNQADDRSSGSVGTGSYARNPSVRDRGRYVQASSLQGTFRIVARNTSRSYVNTSEKGLVTLGPNNADRRSGRWTFEPVSGSHFVRIRNQWKRTYLFVNNGVLQFNGSSKSDPDAHWSLQSAPDNSGHVIIRNRSSNLYLLPEFEENFLLLDERAPQAPSGQWRLDEVGENNGDTRGDSDSRTTTTRKSKITCSGGYIRGGTCRCSSGKTRIKRGRNRYSCTKIKKKTKKNCYTGGCNSYCGPGFVMINSKCIHMTKYQQSKKKKKKKAKKSCYTAGCSSYCGPGYVMLRGKCIHINKYNQMLEDQEG